MIEDICEAISLNSVFSAKDIMESYDMCKSFDTVICAVECCGSAGTMALPRVVKMIVSGSLPFPQDFK